MKSLLCLILSVYVLLPAAGHCATVADLSDRMDKLERSLKTVNKKLSNNYVGSAKRPVENGTDAAVVNAQDLEEKDKKDKIKAAYGKKDAKTLYNEAFAAIKKQNYKSAENQFEAFLELHPKNSLAGNAQYWLGESYFARGQFDKAAIAFAEGFQKYRDSQKAPDNLFKLGLTMARMNKKEEACIAFKNFLTEYPKVSDSMTKRLQKEMNKLSCR